MYDLILFGLGVYTGITVWRALQNRDKMRVVKSAALVVAALMFSFMPAGYVKHNEYWEAMPTEGYIISDGTDVNSWSSYDIATTYSNVRGFVNSIDSDTVLIYNPKSYTVDEARKIYNELK